MILRAPDDFHLHVRQGEMLRLVLPETARVFGRALLMPNIVVWHNKVQRSSRPPPPLRTADDLDWYRSMVMGVLDAMEPRPQFQPLFSIALTDETQPDEIIAAKKAGAIAAKVYPIGVTTNSAWGVSDFTNPSFLSACDMIQEQEMVLCLHGEAARAFCLDREKEFLYTLCYLAGRFPKLRIVFEHVSSAAAVECVKNLPSNVAATVTVHHLLLTLDDVVGDKLKPHHFCKPLAKRPEDRAAIQRVVLEGNPKFFFGSDSAPHDIETKECDDGCAGVFTTPVALPLLADFFSVNAAIQKLEAFTSFFGANFYGLDYNARRIDLRHIKCDWTVPNQYGTVVPFMAGKTLSWKVTS